MTQTDYWLRQKLL